jgi:hypothetical protein
MWWWSSLQSAEHWADAANIALVLALLVGVVATYLIVSTTNVKEQYWAEARESSHLRITELESETAKARAEFAKSEEHIAVLNNETERLKAENLSVQRLLMPRRLEVMSYSPSDAVAKKIFEEAWKLREFVGIEVLLQSAPDSEAETLSRDIWFMFKTQNWNVRVIDETESNFSAQHLNTGIRVYSPSLQTDPDLADKLLKAGQALERIFRMAMLGWEDFPISLSFENDPKWRVGSPSPALPSFASEPRALFVAVGPRPVEVTLRYLEQQRKARGAQ